MAAGRIERNVFDPKFRGGVSFDEDRYEIRCKDFVVFEESAFQTMKVKTMKQNPLAALYLDEDSADIKFICGLDDGESPEPVLAHKCILSACSPVLKTMFYGSLPETGDVRLRDVTADGFRKFLQFFYFDEMVLSMDYVAEVTYLAKKYGVDGCLNICIEFLIKASTVEDCLDCFDLALQLDIPELQKHCESQIKQNPTYFAQTEELVKRSDRVLRLVLSMNAIDEELLMNCMRWARKEWKQRHSGEKLPTLRDILRHFRYFNSGFITY